MANSPLYTYSASVLTLHQAVVRLGINRTRSVIFTSGMASVFRKLDLEEEWVREQLWMHSFMTAVVAWHLNKEFNCGFDGEEFTASILHDFGRLLFAVCLPERLEEIDPLDFDETPFVTRREQDITGVDHCELGAWFAVANRLPEELVEVVRLHHTPEEARVAPRLVALVAAADHLANHLQRNGGPAEYDCRSNTAIELLERSGIRGATDILSKRVEVIMTRAWDQGLQMLNF
jgi:HD-like signal output (HDOD) protein